jgi:hypothetical protein
MYIEDVEAFAGLAEKEVLLFSTEYDKEAQRGILDAVRWAARNPGFDLLPYAPDVRYSNEILFKYIGKIEKSLARFE